MNQLLIKKKGDAPFIFFDGEYGLKLDSYLKGGWGFFDFKNRTDGIKLTEFLDYLVHIFNNIYITYSMIKNEYYDFSNELNSFVYKFNSIGFDINSIIKDHGHEDGYFLNKRKEIERFFYHCIYNSDNKSLTGLIELVNMFYQFQVKVFKSRDLFNLKEDLMDNLKDVCSVDIYNYYNNLYESYLKEDTFDLEKIEKLFLEIQGVILDDWKANIDSVDSYKPGLPFKFICHSTNSNVWSGSYYSRFVSASLLTENHTYTYNQPYGFIMNPNDIIMTDSEDLYIRNNSDDLDNIYLSGVLPTVKSFKNVDENTIYYNEIVLDGFNPIGIFCISDGSKELNPYYLDALELKKKFPNLPILDFDLSYFANDIDTILYRNALVDTIEEEIGIYHSGNSNYYEYFSYFWNDFMNLKKGNYSSRDIINLFKKYYDLINIDLDDLLCSEFDDDFILKLIGANSRYCSIGDIFSDNFDVDDIRTFYNLYSNLSDFSYNRLERLFPKFNNLLNLLDEYMICNGYDMDSLIVLGKFKNYDDLISYLNDYNIDISDNSLDNNVKKILT